MIHSLLTSSACSGISQETAHPKTLNRGNLHSYLLHAETEEEQGKRHTKKGETMTSKGKSEMEE